MNQHYNKQNGAGFSRLFKAMRCSIQGFKTAWQFESAFRQEVALCLLLLPLGLLIASNFSHLLLLLGSLAVLLIVELLNSAIETLADRITLEHDTMIKRSKDMASSAVLLAVAFVAIVWLHGLLSWLGMTQPL